MSAIFQYGGYSVTQIAGQIVQVIAEPVLDSHLDVEPLPHFYGPMNYINKKIGVVHLPEKIAKPFGKYVVIESISDLKPKFAAKVILSNDWLAEYGLVLHQKTYEELPSDDRGEKQRVLLRKLPEIAPDALRRLNFHNYFG